MMAQMSGWGSTQNAAALPVVDAFARNLLMKYGGRTDDIWAFHEMPGYRTSLQGAGFAGNSVANPFIRGTGRVSLSGIGGSNTSSDPGGRNWGTAQNMVNFPAGMYNQYRGKQKFIQQKQKVEQLQAARQQKQQQAAQAQAQQSQLTANTQAYNATFNPNMNYPFQYQQQMGAQNPNTGATPRRRANAATVKFNPKTGQRQTKSGLVIPPGTTSI